ncbi:MAG: GNAT family N-acetyltransferase [Paludibacter sp.]|nr:GNAT family N-acetyltransferase [Paludibacter sp.]
MFENNIVRLRAVEPEDLELLYEWENNSELWEVGNTRNPYSHYILKQYILNSDKDIYETLQLRLMMVSVITGKTVGTVDLFDFDIHHSRIALGLYVDEKFQGLGFAKASLRVIEEYVFGYLKINQLYCHISESNAASRHMFEKEQYQSNGLLKEWINSINGFENIIVFQQFRNEYLNREKSLE